MRAIISVIGVDTVGIIAAVSEVLSDHNVNILEITQSVIDKYFAMVLLADLSKGDVDVRQLSDLLTAVGEKKQVQIHTMHEDIFNSMHRI